MGVRPERLNLVAFQFRMFQRRGHADSSAGSIDLVCYLASLSWRNIKQVLHHLDNVLPRVFRIVPQNDMVSRLLLALGRCVFWKNVWFGDGGIGI